MIHGWIFSGSFWQSQQARPSQVQHVHITQVAWIDQKNHAKKIVKQHNRLDLTFFSSAGWVFWQPCSLDVSGVLALPLSFSLNSHQRSEPFSFLSIRYLGPEYLDFWHLRNSWFAIETWPFQYFGSSILALAVAAACMGHLEKMIWSNMAGVKTHFRSFFFNIIYVSYVPITI